MHTRPNKQQTSPDMRCAILGLPGTVERVLEQIQMLPESRRPEVAGVIGWRDRDLTLMCDLESRGIRVLGAAHQLDEIVDRERVDLVAISLPAVMSEAVSAVRTAVRRLGIADRFFPTIEDLIDGVGPRTHIDIDPARLIDRHPHRIDESAIRATLRGQTVLITGAGGSIGSELARRVATFEPGRLVLMERSENALFEIDRQLARAFPDIERCAVLHDVTESVRTQSLCEQIRPDVVFHAAAHKHVPMMEDHPVAAIRNNFLGTKAIADAADACGCDRFVMISTDKAVNPTSIMGATKRLAELYIQHMNATSVTLFRMVRFGNVLGSAGSVLTTWEQLLREGGAIPVTHPEMQRYFMTIPEAAALVLQATALDDVSSGGEVLLLDMGQPVRIVDLARRFIREHGLEPIVADARRSTVAKGLGTSGSVTIEFIGTRPGEKLFEELAYDTESIAPTSHPGIHVWHMEPPSRGRIEKIVETLQRCADHEGSLDAGEAADLLRGLLPEMTFPVVRSGPEVARVTTGPSRGTVSAA